MLVWVDARSWVLCVCVLGWVDARSSWVLRVLCVLLWVDGRSCVLCVWVLM